MHREMLVPPLDEPSTSTDNSTSQSQSGNTAQSHKINVGTMFQLPSQDDTMPMNHWNEMYLDDFSTFIAPLASTKRLKELIDGKFDITSDMVSRTDGVQSQVFTGVFTKANYITVPQSPRISVYVPRKDKFVVQAGLDYQEYLDHTALYTTRPNSFSAKHASLLYPLANKDQSWRVAVLAPFYALSYIFNRQQANVQAVMTYHSFTEFTQITITNPSNIIEDPILIDSRLLCSILGLNAPQDNPDMFNAAVWAMTGPIGASNYYVDISQANTYTLNTGAGVFVTPADVDAAYEYLYCSLDLDDFLLGLFCYPRYLSGSSFIHSDLVPETNPTALALTKPLYNFVDHYLVHKQTLRNSTSLSRSVHNNMHILRMLCQNLCKYTVGQAQVQKQSLKSYRDYNVDPFMQHIWDNENSRCLDYIPMECVPYFGGNHPAFEKLYSQTFNDVTGVQSEMLDVTLVETGAAPSRCYFLPKYTYAIASYVPAGAGAFVQAYYNRKGATFDQNYHNARISRAICPTFVTMDEYGDTERWSIALPAARVSSISWAKFTQVVRVTSRISKRRDFLAM